MRTKKIFSFNEEKDAEEIILNGFENGVIDYSKMYIIAKYFRDKFRYGETRLEKKLIEFCIEKDKNFNPIVDAEIVKKWVKSAMMYRLRKIKDLKISKTEIDFLKAVETNKERKLLFATLIMAKALKHRNTRRNKTDTPVSDKYYIHYSNLMDIIRLSELKNVTELNLVSVLHKYRKHFVFYSPEKQLIKVNYADSQIKRGTSITDFDNLMSYYDKFFTNQSDDDKIIYYCKNCGVEIVKTSNRQRYCPECSEEIRRTKQKELMRERRKQ